jgi:hypothetical protein
MRKSVALLVSEIVDVVVAGAEACDSGGGFLTCTGDV